MDYPPEKSVEIFCLSRDLRQLLEMIANAETLEGLQEKVRDTHWDVNSFDRKPPWEK